MINYQCEFLNSFGPLIDTDIYNFENKLHINFPRDYKNFLLKINGGKPKKNIFSISDNDNESVINNIFGIVDERYYNLSLYYEIYKDRIPGNTLPIASDVFGNLIILSVKGDDYGKVYFWDHELETEPADYSNLTLIAGSFDEFINNLKSEEEIEEELKRLNDSKA